MKEIKYLQTNKLYILSGLSASGKSSFVTNLTTDSQIQSDCFISSDKIRKDILGVEKNTDDFGIYDNLYGWSVQNQKIFEIIETAIGIRLKEKLLTFIDATNLNDKAREPYVKIANQYGMDYEVLIFDPPLDILKSRLANRQERFPSHVIEQQNASFNKSSKYPYQIINTDKYEYRILPNLIDTVKLDVVGDSHALYNPLLKLLNKAGWEIKNKSLQNYDNERKILFLGDIIDRGQNPIDILNLVMNLVNEDKAYFILGNHENKLINALKKYFDDNTIRSTSFSNTETLVKIINQGREYAKDIFDFLLRSKAQYSLWIDNNNNPTIDYDKAKLLFGFVHGNIETYNPYGIPSSIAMYGKRNDFSDLQYEKNFKNGINNHILIRGHIPNNHESNYVYSLDRKQAYDGELLLLPLDKFIQTKNLNITNFERTIMKQETKFNYDNYLSSNKKLFFDLQQLQKDKLVSAKEQDGLVIFKYSKQVFFKKLWNTHPALLQARGIVFDIAGNIVQNPFDKIFNFKENDTGKDIKPEQDVVVVEKLNGFLGCISKHPFKNDLLITTTGSFDSDFTNFIKDLISPKLKANLFKYFNHNNDTLMFEVIHKNDPHIIEYKDNDYGLWLIGCRNKELHSNLKTEQELDNIAKSLEVKRPFHYISKFKDVLSNLNTEKIEGYMIRENTTNENTLLKIKTNYYLTTKFVGRMSQKFINIMYDNPDLFKTNHIDEEFFPIVDSIINNIPKEQFLSMDESEKVNLVRNIVEDSVKINNPKNKL